MGCGPVCGCDSCRGADYVAEYGWPDEHGDWPAEPAPGASGYEEPARSGFAFRHVAGASSHGGAACVPSSRRGYVCAFLLAPAWMFTTAARTRRQARLIMRTIAYRRGALHLRVFREGLSREHDGMVELAEPTGAPERSLTADDRPADIPRPTMAVLLARAVLTAAPPASHASTRAGVAR